MGFKNWLVFVGVHFALGVAVYVGGFLDVSWVGWIAAAFVWFVLFICLIVLRDPEMRRKEQQRGSSIPAWIAWPIDIGFVAAFIAVNWYMTAAAYVATCLVLIEIRSRHSVTSWWVALTRSPIRAEAVRGIDLPSTLGGFELESVIDHEKSNPGFGVALLYNTLGVKVTVFLYDHSQDNIPDGADSPVIRKEFAEARIDVQQVYPDAQILVREERLLVEGIPILHSAIQYTETNPGSGEAVFSHLYLTARKGKFVKVRATYSFSARPELGHRMHIQFIENLCRVVAS